MEETNQPCYMRYWGKALSSHGSKGNDYHLLPYHNLDVAACGYQLVMDNRFHAADILCDLHFSRLEGAKWFAYFLAMHDIGKFARGFQQLFTHNSRFLVPDAGKIYRPRHDSLGYWIWRNHLLPRWLNDDLRLLPDTEKKTQWIKSLDIWLRIATGHHGIPPDTTSGDLAFTQEDMAAAASYLTDLQQVFTFSSFPPQFADTAWRSRLKQQSWLLAALAILADWLGSNQNYFSYDSKPMPMSFYWLQAQQKAKIAMASLPAQSSVNTYQGYQHLFPFIKHLSPLQRYACEVDINLPGPQLHILEDVTGAGKTEAAIILANRLMSQGKADGMYVGLPTMATANAMYQRLAGAYRLLFSPSSHPSLVLAHGASKMSPAFRQSVWQGDNQGQENYGIAELSASAECNSWFADSRKKSLLAEVGVGTLDQLLMAAMPYRHQSLRLLGIYNKVLLLDEVHAYDGYMLRLLEGLLAFHAAQGGSVIILSATLPYSLRSKLLEAYARGVNWQTPSLLRDAAYPWATFLHQQGLAEQSLATRPEVRRSVEIGWLTHVDEGIEIIEEAAVQQRCICWVRNSVDDAISIYTQLIQRGNIPSDNIMLFHSRFAFTDRLRIEQTVMDWFGKNTDCHLRCGKVFIATQVVEQSLDIDFDMMISDLAPIDLLIQRAGRLQRHIRDHKGNLVSSLPEQRPAPVLTILAPPWQPDAQVDWLGSALRNTGYVYADHACLWRTQAMLRASGTITLPEHARIMVESVYGETMTTPKALMDVADNIYGKRLGERAAAQQNILSRDKGYDRLASDTLWSDAIEFSTRLSEPTLDIYLAYQTPEGIIPYAQTDDFPWEKSRVQVRAGWWQQFCTKLPQLQGDELQNFRRLRHKPQGYVLLIADDAGIDYYHRALGLLGGRENA